MIRIRSQADIPSALYAIRILSTEIGMNHGASAAIATAASEIVTNVVKYAKSGTLTLQARCRNGRPGIEVVVQDFGPGIGDVNLALTDRYSTGGTLGLGLPGARRLVDEFEIASERGQGTRVRILKWG
ncbi:MAG: serine/threonine protein kinase [Rhizobiaceae bacterium MnEN-MB40S]|nr:MAG: serine/threonine protein kinase [Rhizobiaceae bacterium MnEN-MB40S]